MFCMKCGTQLPDSARFCCKCGSPVQMEVSPASAPTPAPAPVPAPRPMATREPEEREMQTEHRSNASQYTTRTQETKGVKTPSCLISVDKLKTTPNAKKINPFKVYESGKITFDGEEIRIEAVFMTPVQLRLEDIARVSMYHAILNCNGISIEQKYGDGYYLYTGFGEFGYKARLEKLEIMVEEINKRLR